MWERFKEYTADAALFGCALAFAINFILIAIYKGIYIYENRPWVLGLELALCVFLMWLAIDRWKREK